MAQFKFKLEAVLRHRAAIEKEKQRDFAEALARYKALEDRLKAMNQTLQDTNTDLRDNRLVGRIDVGFITAHRRYLVGVQRQAMELAGQMAREQKLVDAARAALAEAARQKKVLEKLKETQAGRWKEELAKKELAQLDEVAMQLSFIPEGQ